MGTFAAPAGVILPWLCVDRPDSCISERTRCNATFFPVILHPMRENWVHLTLLSAPTKRGGEHGHWMLFVKNASLFHLYAESLNDVCNIR